MSDENVFTKIKNICAKYINVKFLKAKHIRAKTLCVENINGPTGSNLVVDNLTANNINTNTETVSSLNAGLINGVDFNCAFTRPAVNNVYNGFDCNDCEGNPIKPDTIDQDIWDALTCNWKAYQSQLQDEFLQGRNQIRCIKKAFGCAPECPPDCPTPAGCTALTCPSPPDCTIPPECIPDPNTCDQSVDNLFFASKTVPAFTATPCPNPNAKWTVTFSGGLGFSLDLTNTTCTLSERVATVLVQYAYKGAGPTGTTGTTGCPQCPGQTGPVPLTCLCQSPDITCGIVEVACRQFAATININFGENFAGQIPLPSDIYELIYSLHKDDNSQGAFQMVIFLEDGLQVLTNKTRFGTPASNTDSNETRLPVP